MNWKLKELTCIFKGHVMKDELILEIKNLKHGKTRIQHLEIRSEWCQRCGLGHRGYLILPEEA